MQTNDRLIAADFEAMAEALDILVPAEYFKYIDEEYENTYDKCVREFWRAVEERVTEDDLLVSRLADCLKDMWYISGVYRYSVWREKITYADKCLALARALEV